MYKRTDNNQKKLVEQIRRLGASVTHLHALGKGNGDLLIGIRGKNFLLEVKDPAKSPSRKKLTKDEVKFHAAWQGQICIVETIDDVIKLIQ